MRLGRVATQWATVLVLLIMVLAINHFFPEWNEVSVGQAPERRGGDYDAIDGDSFRAGGIEVRLHGIDAPEYRQTCSDNGRNVACGKMARDALSKLIGSRNVGCKAIDHDRYGREVAVCKRNTLEINREMVRLGWAIAYRRHALNYVADERAAKQAKRGIWAWEFEMPEAYRAKQRATQGGLAED
jgi:endonuclease YncB( thermonuclease family)